MEFPVTRDEIIKTGRFSVNNSVDQLELFLYIPFFEKSIRILALNLTSISPEKTHELTTEIINELLSYPLTNRNWLKKEIYNHFLTYISSVEYGDKTTHQIDSLENRNKSFFKIYSEEDAFDRAELDFIWFDVTYTEFRYFNLEYKCPWETEHGIKIGIMNGQFDSIQ
jgi:hypothetical protein